MSINIDVIHNLKHLAAKASSLDNIHLFFGRIFILLRAAPGSSPANAWLLRNSSLKPQPLAKMMADQLYAFSGYHKPLRHDELSKTMASIGPWAALCKVFEFLYPKAGNGHQPTGFESGCASLSFGIRSAWPTCHGKGR